MISRPVPSGVMRKVPRIFSSPIVNGRAVSKPNASRYQSTAASRSVTWMPTRSRARTRSRSAIFVSSWSVLFCLCCTPKPIGDLAGEGTYRLRYLVFAEAGSLLRSDLLAWNPDRRPAPSRRGLPNTRAVGVRTNRGSSEGASMPRGRLQGKRVLITGIGGGMGRAAALRFGQEGAVVIGSDIDEETSAETTRLAREQGIDIDFSAPVDLTDYEQV